MAEEERPDQQDQATENPVADPDEDEFLPRRELLDQIDEAIEAEDRDRLNALLEPMHAADIADIIERLHGADRRNFLQLYSEITQKL